MTFNIKYPLITAVRWGFGVASPMTLKSCWWLADAGWCWAVQTFDCQGRLLKPTHLFVLNLMRPPWTKFHKRSMSSCKHWTCVDSQYLAKHGHIMSMKIYFWEVMFTMQNKHGKSVPLKTCISPEKLNNRIFCKTLFNADCSRSRRKHGIPLPISLPHLISMENDNV